MVGTAAMTHLEQSMDVKNRQKLRTAVKHGSRWLEMVSVLGWVILLFIPESYVPNTWVVHTLRLPQLQAWLKVAALDSELRDAARLFEDWLRPEVKTGDICTKPYPEIETLQSESFPASLHGLFCTTSAGRRVLYQTDDQYYQLLEEV